MNDLDLKIEHILKDLYQIDPAFKQYESKIKNIIKEVLLAKPDTKFDEAFAQSLRHKLMAQADLQKEKQNISLLGSLKSLRKLNYALSALTVVAVVAGIGVYYRQNRAITPVSNDLTRLFSSETKITPMGKEAFGKLALSPQAGYATGKGGGGAAPEMSSAPSDKTAAGQSDQASAPAAPLGMGGGGIGTMPSLVNYEYVYKGEKFTVDNDQMDVYRRVRSQAAGADVTSLFKKLDFGLIGINTFSNLGLQNMNVAEDKEFGYVFNVDLLEGSLSASENWLKWPNPERQCQDPKCYEDLRLKLSDIPDDQTLISITGQFLKDHAIKTEGYGTPFVQNNWKDEYARFADKAQFYIPNILTVIYPQKINDQEIYDEGGNKTGLAVSVDVRFKKVSGFGMLHPLNYDSSSYALETDPAKLIETAKRGGYTGNYTYENASRTEQVELGTPSLVYVKTYQYHPAGGLGDELLVPALVFPITKVPQGANFYYQKNVVVPLAKDLLPQDNGPIRIMPAQ